MQPSDSLLWSTLAAITLAAIAGGVIFIVRAFRGEAVPTADPLERIVADLFRQAPSGLTFEAFDSSTGRMRALVSSLAEAEALRAGHPAAPEGRRRAS